MLFPMEVGIGPGATSHRSLLLNERAGTTGIHEYRDPVG